MRRHSPRSRGPVMSYENLPDPRPLGVRLVVGPMPRFVAVAVTVGLVTLFAVAVIGLFSDWQHHAFGWGTLAMGTGVFALQYALAIRWNDLNRTWPRRRYRRRSRVMR
jgi:sterol desaturase/sphingolipid hydroxylase (fatty acid hydroxylase superfamily)